MERPTPAIFDKKRRYPQWRFKQKNGEHILQPGALAEDLDPDAALISLRHYLTLQKPEGHLLSAWAHVEYAMNQRATVMDDDLRRKYVDDAIYLLAGILNVDGSSKVDDDSRLHIDALSLNSFLPLFIKRALSKTATRQDCADLYASSGILLNHLLHPPSANMDVSYRKTKLSENLGRALATRAFQPELIMYIASPREESSPIASLNHDSYFIKNGAKIPIQKKLIEVNRTYSYPVQVLYMERIARHALQRAQVDVEKPDEPSDFPATTLLSSFVAQEALRRELTRQEIYAVDLATRSIAARYRYDPVAA